MAKETSFDLNKLTRFTKQRQEQAEQEEADRYGRRAVKPGEVLATIKHGEPVGATEVSPEELRRIVSKFK